MNRASSYLRIALCMSLAWGALASTGCVRTDQTAELKQAVVHSDADGIPDHIEAQLGTDPSNPDTDHDGLSDYYELVVMSGKRAQTSSASPLEKLVGVDVAMATESTSTSPTVYAEAWKAINPAKPYDSNLDGVHEALDPYGPEIQVTLDATLVGRIHSAITKKNGFDWGGRVPTAKQYNDAFVALMMDEANTPAPLIADGQRVVVPDLSDPLTEDKATSAWKGRTYQAKIPVWKLDDPDHGGDGDGIPNGYETYGYHWDGQRFLPWGFTLSGKSSYTPAGVGFEIVGNELTPLKPEERDYGVQYFKTDHSQMSSDADPYSDKLESTSSNLPQTVKSPSDRPVVAAYPSIVGYLGEANVTIKQDITTTTGKKITHGAASGSIKAGSVYPTVPITGFVMGKNRPTTGAVAQGLDFVDKKAVGFAVAALSDDPAAAASFPPIDLNAKFDMSEDDWSQAVSLKTDSAAALDFEAILTNTGFANASRAEATLDVLVGDSVVRSIQTPVPIDELPAQGTHSMHVNDVVLSLDQLKSYQSGAPVTLRVNQVDAEVMVPKRDGDTISYTDAGKWGPFASAIDNWCARITVDMGDGTFATYPVMAKTAGGFSTTLLDGLLWSVGVYDDGAYQRLNVPGFLPGQGTQQSIPSFEDWMFVFDDKYTQESIGSADSIFDVALVPGSHIYARSPIADGDRPVVTWATVASASNPTYDITNEDKKIVSAAVDADLAVGDVWVAPSSDATQSAWTQMTDPDSDGVYTATLPASWRVIAGKTAIIARSASRWGDGTAGASTVSTPAKPVSPTGVRGSLSGTITKFPDNDVSKQIVCFDFDAPVARVESHSKWSSPPSGTDLATWYYSVTSHFNNNGYQDSITAFTGYAMTYAASPTPRWVGVASAWDSKSPNYSLSHVKTAKGKISWSHPPGHSKIWEKSYVGSDSQSDFITKGETFLLKTSDGRWVKATVSSVTYKDMSTLEKISMKYTAYDPGQ